MGYALDLLNEGKTKYDRPGYLKYWQPVVWGIAGFSFAAYLNWFQRKPLISGIQKHILYSIAGAGIGKFASDFMDNYYAERDAILRHYVELHPEDFPDPVRKKWKDVMESWPPCR